MRSKLLLVILLGFSSSLWAAVNIEHWQTDRGSRVYYVHSQNLPLVDIRITFDAGSARDGDKHGLAALTAAMLGTGAANWNAFDIAKRFESVGAQFGNNASIDMATVSLRTLTQKPLYDKAVETLKTILAKPTFHQADFDREQKRTLAALKHREESPGAVASLAYFKALYHDHPYAYPSLGYLDTVSKLTPEDLRQFYRHYYVASNAVIAIVGDLTRQQAEKLADELLNGLPTGDKPKPIPPVDLPQQGTTRHIAFPSTQTHVLAGLPGVTRKDRDYFDLYVGNHILGGSGLISRLFKEVREKRGLAYSAYSYFSPMRRKGPFTLGLQTRNDQTEQALKVMIDTLTDFVDKAPTEAELTAAKKNITGGFVLRFDTNRKLSQYVSMIGFYQLPLDYLDTFQDKVRAVTVESIKQAFSDRIRPEKLQIVTVGGE